MIDYLRKLIATLMAIILGVVPQPTRERETPPVPTPPVVTRPTPPAIPVPSPTRTRETAMRIIWNDEGNGAQFAPASPWLWTPKLTDEWQNPAELQNYENGNAYYDGEGNLVLRATRVWSNGFQYSSARLHGTKRFQYGALEARIKVPSGVGTWPALWLLGDDSVMGWPRCGEIDVMEIPVIAGESAMVHQGTHNPNANNADVPVGIPATNGEWSDDYHVYTVYWQPELIEFYVDFQLTGKITRALVESRGGEWVFDDREMIPIVNLAIGGWAGTPDAWDSQEMLIDWVRVYQ